MQTRNLEPRCCGDLGVRRTPRAGYSSIHFCGTSINQSGCLSPTPQLSSATGWYFKNKNPVTSRFALLKSCPLCDCLQAFLALTSASILLLITGIKYKGPVSASGSVCVCVSTRFLRKKTGRASRRHTPRPVCPKQTMYAQITLSFSLCRYIARNNR